MHAIKRYIDDLFQEIPETEEIKQIKSDLYLNAMDRYDELIASGKSDSEAIGTIIIEMGELDDLFETLEYDQQSDLKDYSLNTLEEAKHILSAHDQAGSKISLGILLILIGAGFISTFDSFDIVEVGVIVLLSFVAIGVGLFTNTGLKLETIEKRLTDKDQLFYLDDEDYATVEEEYFFFKEKEGYRIAVGVVFCILAAVPIISFAFLDKELLIERFGVPILMLFVGFGVYQFVKYGMTDSAFQKLLNLGEYSVAERRFQKKIEPFAGIYWLSITIVYLAWSFYTFNWHFTWIIFPVAGMLWGIISIFLKMRSDREEH